MATATRKCKVCGAEYEYCRTYRRTDGVFRYQDVACCAEHGNIYLAKIIESRSKSNTEAIAAEAEPDEAIKVTENLDVCEDDDEDDKLFEEEFDDDADEPEIET